MKIDSLETKCYQFFLHNSEKIPPFPQPIREKILTTFRAFLGRQNNGLNRLLIEKINPAFEDIERWKTTFIFFKGIGSSIPTNLTQLSFFYLTENTDRQKLNNILDVNKNLEIIDLQGIKLTQGFVNSCKDLKFLKILKLKQCSGIEYSQLLELFSEESPPIEELALPLLDLNDEHFPELLEKCGKNLKHLYVEHKGRDRTTRRTLNGKTIIKITISNSFEVAKIDYLFQIGIFCPNLESIALVNFQFSAIHWLDRSFESECARIWKNIFAPLKELKVIELKNYCKFGYSNVLSFLETMDLSSWQKLIIERMPIQERTIETVQTKYPQLKFVVKDCHLLGSSLLIKNLHA